MPSLASPLPLRLGRPEEFAAVRAFFQRAQFDDTTLCRVFGMADMSDLGQVPWEKFRLDIAPSSSSPAAGGVHAASAFSLLPGEEPEAAEKQSPITTEAPARDPALDAESLRWCVQTFVRGLSLPTEESRRICGEEVFEAFHALGLLRAAAKRPQTVLCPVWVYPADGFVMASDRREDPEGEPFTTPPDVVFPAIYAGTLRFLRLLPSVPEGEALDLCGGSGIGALHLSRMARRAATADITQRSSFFAEFNARLNGVTIGDFCGDLYAPVVGQQFDLISAHPPFVPATGPNMVYRDGGDTGEEVTQRIIEGLPAHLRRGGTCVILCVARDTTRQTFEQRARAWLGAAALQFDLVFGLEKILTVEGVVESMRKRGQQITQQEARDLLVRLRSLDTRQFVYGALFVRRCAEPVTDEPLRLRLSPSGTAADFERVLAWRRYRRQPGFNEWLTETRPRLVPALELTARHVVQDGELVPAEFVFSISAGLSAALRPDAWVVPLLARLDGKPSVREVFEQARAADDLPPGFGLSDFAGLVQGMIERGFLAVDFPL